ncbi:hypothetical protein BC941DRAFT_468110 [Chlamydoabsidia padenii]|nr:hypothetical protein BC941DRAFT_468110 [Chlamydoabsidia padenii]
MWVGLEAWVGTWRHTSDDWLESYDQVRRTCLALRRMVSRPALSGLKTRQVMIDRLSQVGRLVETRPVDQDDSACELSADDMDDGSRVNHGKLNKRMGKVAAILHGI